MSVLHLVQGGIDNGDLAWLIKAAHEHLDSPRWVVPKTALPGDHVVVFIGGYGFFATATITSLPSPREDWPNRYGAYLTGVSLIEPPISLGTILRRFPELSWARYPRSITTPSPSIAKQIRASIANRRRHGARDLKAEALADAGIQELRAVALLAARPRLTAREKTVLYRTRSLAIRLYVLSRAAGDCEGCKTAAPFFSANGKPYLEPHHTTRVADDGPDHPAHVIALCPNCHRRAHLSEDAIAFNTRLKKTLVALEPRKRPNPALQRARDARR